MPITSLRARLNGAPWWSWVALGTIGSLGLALAGSDVGAVPRPTSYRWWFRVPLGGYGGAHAVLYAAMAALGLAWLGLGMIARRGSLSRSRVLVAAVAWAAPLFAGAPLFSRDIYSYIAQGELAASGLNPYHVAPSALAHDTLYYSLAAVWRHTPSPYGPLFVLLTRAGARVAGTGLIEQILVFRALELVGLALGAWAIVIIARRLHANEGVALWLAVLSPLALLSDVSAAHNDTLMIGLLLAGIALSLRGARRGALALIAVAGAVKLPALAGVAVLTVRDLRGVPWRRGAVLVIEALVITVVVLAASTLVNGYGWTWASPTALSIPSELRTLATPSVSVGAFIAATLRVAGAHTLSTHTVVSVVQYVFDVATLGVIAMALLTIRAYNAVRVLGAVLLAVVLGGPTLWPWYLLWGLSVLAGTSAQSSRALAIGAVGATLLVGPGGSPMLGGNAYLISAPFVAGAIYWLVRHNREREILERADRVA
ncbi:MAG TPA: polyprenol phosphomannose-dependent alpha 1,6 mannosyltransferase MptB [Acidimicrobiales bacterium]|nr:polyprenol phosphomannose-dependent alpha 1,6 mannosyltransferase MptB [Acidimicrobiales bacterium]